MPPDGRRPADGGALSIGEAARLTGHTPVTLRHWERVGLLDPPPRSSGRRRYARSALARIRLIDAARASGFRLTEIRELLADRDPPRPPGERWRALADRKRAELDRIAAAIDAMRHVLDHLADRRCDSLDECAVRIGEAGLGAQRVDGLALAAGPAGGTQPRRARTRARPPARVGMADA